MRGVEIGAIEVVQRLARDRFHEAHSVADRRDHARVFVGQWRMADPVQAPVFGMVQVGETAVDQRAHEIHRHRRARMRLQQAARIGRTRSEFELGAIDDVAAVAWQGRAVARFGVGRTRLRVLARKAADAHDRLAQPVHEHEAHLQQHLQAVRDDLGRAVAEALGAIAALQQEAFAFLCIGELLLEREDLPRRHQRWQAAQFGERGFQRVRIGVVRQLRRRARAPALRRPHLRLRGQIRRG